MLSTALVLEVRRLVEERQLSHRTIAVKLGVSRGAVSNIASGRRGLHGRDPAAAESAEVWTAGTSVRCHGCGGRVYEPCLLCRARAYRTRGEMVRRLMRELEQGHARPRHVA